MRSHTSAAAGRLTINFHPDRVSTSGFTVAEGLASTGKYLSQFVTGISNGSRSAIRGGDRDGWEVKLFGDRYRHAAPDVARPVYGAWDLLRDPHGGSPRFGSSYVIVSDHVRDRTTLCVGDSHADPVHLGSFSDLKPILDGLREQATHNTLLGRPMGIGALETLLHGEILDSSVSRNLDGYVEAQIHGGVSLAADIEAIVLDPSFHSTEVEFTMATAAAQYGFAVGWHDGSELLATECPADFRGPKMVALAAEVARPDGVVDARALGKWARRIPHDQPPVFHGDDVDSDRQLIKYLWHVVLAFGHAADADG